MRTVVIGLVMLAGMGWLVPLKAIAKTESVHSEAQQVSAAEGTAALCPSQLPEAIRAIANRPQFQRSRWGILIRRLDTEETLYEQEATRYFIPASNVKLFTTAAVLQGLGPQFRIRTSVYQVSESPNNTVLRIVGRGDPSLTNEQLGNLADQLQQRGITRVDRVIADDQYFQGDPINSGWEWEDIQSGYGAPVNSLILNQNEISLTLSPQALGQPLRVDWDEPSNANQWQIDNRSVTVAASEPEFVNVGRDVSQPILRVSGQLRVGSEPDTSAIAILNPTQYFLQTFQRTLAAHRISVGQGAIATRPDSSDTEVASVLSPPVADLILEANQDSNNLYAESLLRILGVTRSPADTTTSSLEAGLAAVQTILAPLGVDPQGYQLADGSGLSRHNLVSPAALVQVLMGMARSPHADLFRRSLAVAGERGTLQNRFRDTPVQGRLRGKTGAMSGVAALSGYLDPPHYSPLVLSILVNQADQPIRQVRPAIDEIVLLLGRLTPCGGAS